MPVKRSRLNSNYGFPSPLANQFPDPIVQQRDPTTQDQGEVGQLWINNSSQTFFVLTSSSNGTNVWTSTTAGATTLASLLVTPGNATVDTGNLLVTLGTITSGGLGTFGSLSTGNATIGGTLGVTGATTVTDLTASGNVVITGDLDFTGANAVSITTTSNTNPAFSVTANGGVLETIVLTSAQGTSAGSVSLISTAGGVTIQGGLATADAINILSGATGGIDMDYGSAGMTVTGANGAFTLATGTGAVNLATDAVQKVVTVGNITGNTAVNVNSGTAGITLTSTGAGDVNVVSGDAVLIDGAGVIELNSSAAAISIGNDAVAQAINIGTGAAARTITVGNVTGATAVTVNSGTGGISLFTTGAGDVIIDSDDTVTIDADGILEINSSAGVIGIGNDADANNINIGTGAADRVITIGNVTGASQVVLNSGTAGVAINTTGAGDVVVTSADTVLIDSAGVLELNSSAGVISIGNDAVAQNINVGTGAAARVITVGNATGATSVVVNGGTGAMSFGANAVAHTTTVGSVTGAAATVVQGGTAGITLTAPFVALPGPVYIYTGAGAPAGALALHVGDLYINTTAASAVTRMYCADGVGTWVNFTMSA